MTEVASPEALGPLTTFGTIEEKVLAQINACQRAEPGAPAPAVLCADNHLGYSMPIGGVIAYRRHISPSAVGYDIGCGNTAVKLDMPAPKGKERARIMDEVWHTISFGVGRKNQEKVEHPILDEIARCYLPFQKSLATLAADQLGTVGSGNHYVDLFEDRQDGRLWIGVHFGSRGFGHKTATWALEQAGATDQSMMAPPVLIDAGSPLGQDYVCAMDLAGNYAAAGRAWVADRVRKIVDNPTILDFVNNHHNFAWREAHGGLRFWVHRKGSTPLYPGQRGFVGASMGEDAVIIRGIESPKARAALYSTVHGAGRVLSRSQAAGKVDRKTGEVKRPGLVDFDAVSEQMRRQGIELRGGGADEAPECYKRLSSVLHKHAGTFYIEHRLAPIGVAMAGRETHDPYKD